MNNLEEVLNECMSNVLEVMDQLDMEDPGVIIFAPFTEDGERGAMILQMGNIKEEDYFLFGKAVNQIIKTL